MQGKFITIEGIEGVGKSTNIDFIASYLESHNINLMTTREPGGTELAEKIREILLNPQKEDVPEIAELLFANLSSNPDSSANCAAIDFLGLDQSFNALFNISKRRAAVVIFLFLRGSG